MTVNKKNYFKFSVALVVCLLIRLIPFRAPNIEPIMATVMPFSKAYGAWIGFFFAVLSILSYDLITGTIGIQTFFTALSYGIVGLWATYYFQKKEASAWNYARFAIMGTLFFDAFTGLTVGPLFLHQSFMGALVGQVPFTALHLLGNTAFALILSPAIYSLLVKKKEKQKVVPLGSLNFTRPVISSVNGVYQKNYQY